MQLLVLVPAGKEAGEIRRVSLLAGELQELSGIREVFSPLPSSLSDLSETEIRAYLSHTPPDTGIPLFADKCEYASYQVLRLFLDGSRPLKQTIGEITAVLDEKAPGFYMSGEPYLEGEMYTSILNILLFLPPVVILLLLGVFRLRIGSARAALVSMVPAVTGATLTFGILTWVRGSISVMSSLIPVFIITLTSADALHVTSHVMNELGKGKSNPEAISRALRTVGILVIMTSLTTAAAFLSLLIIDSPALRELALTAAGGILLAGIITWVILPILLSHQKPLQSKQRGKDFRPVRLSGKMKGTPVLIFSLLLLAFSVPGILRLSADFSPVEMYGERSAVRQSVDAVSDIMGGGFPLTVLVETDDIFSMETIDAVRKLTSSEEYASVSLYSLIASFAEEAGIEGEVLSDPALLSMTVETFREFQPQMIDSFLREDGESGKKYLRVIFNLDSIDTELLYSIATTCEELSEGELILHPADSAFGIMETNRMIIPRQIQAVLLALAAVIIITAFFLRSLKLSLISIVPTALTLAGQCAVMGYAGIEDSIMTSVMSSVTIGVSLGYAIHYVSCYRTLRRTGEAEPARKAMGSIGAPILAHITGLGVGFTLLLLSPLQILTNLSILMWVTMILSSILSLILLPALLKH